MRGYRRDMRSKIGGNIAAISFRTADFQLAGSGVRQELDMLHSLFQFIERHGAALEQLTAV